MQWSILEKSEQLMNSAYLKFATKGYFQSKTEKVNIPTEFCIFKLFLVPNFNLN